MQVYFVIHLFQLIVFVSFCSGRPGRNIKSTVAGSKTAFKSGHYGQDDNDTNKNNDADDHPPQLNRDGDNESQNTYEYDDKGAGVYEKLDQIVYPFQQYIQVRHSYSVEHLPIKEESDDNVKDKPHDNVSHQNAASASSNKKSLYKNHPLKKHRRNRNQKSNLNLDTSASTKNENSNYDDTENQDEENDSENEEDYESQSSYKDVKPRLKEEIEDYKKQEVYEEKGYADGAYDHENYGTREDQTYHDKDRDENSEYQEDDNNDKYQTEDQPSSFSTQKNSKSKSSTSSKYPRRRTPHLSELPTSTKLLEYAASNLYDKEAHEKGIYAARDNIHCPEVTDFNLSSKKMAMGKGGKNPRGSKPRLTGLGDKIKCLKEKYFGRVPLPPQIFMDPAESRVTAIKIPTFDQFYKSFRTEVDSISDFQHF